MQTIKVLEIKFIISIYINFCNNDRKSTMFLLSFSKFVNFIFNKPDEQMQWTINKSVVREFCMHNYLIITYMLLLAAESIMKLSVYIAPFLGGSNTNGW